MSGHKGQVGTPMRRLMSPAAKKRLAYRQAAEKKRWAKLNGPVTIRNATEEELKNFGRKPP